MFSEIRRRWWSLLHWRLVVKLSDNTLPGYFSLRPSRPGGGSSPERTINWRVPSPPPPCPSRPPGTPPFFSVLAVFAWGQQLDESPAGPETGWSSVSTRSGRCVNLWQRMSQRRRKGPADQVMEAAPHWCTVLFFGFSHFSVRIILICPKKSQTTFKPWNWHTYQVGKVTRGEIKPAKKRSGCLSSLMLKYLCYRWHHQCIGETEALWELTAMETALVTAPRYPWTNLETGAGWGEKQVRRFQQSQKQKVCQNCRRRTFEALRLL